MSNIVGGYKRQRLDKGVVLAVPPTVFEEPDKTLLNFPSSVMNGVTQEGGLVSLTLKSVTFVELVESIELMRDALHRDESEQVQLAKVVDTQYDSKEAISKLQKELSSSSEKYAQVKERSTDDEISKLQDHLLELVSSKQNITTFGESLKKNYEHENPGKNLTVSNTQFDRVYGLQVPGNEQ